MRTEWIDLKVSDGSEMRAYVAYPNGNGPHRAIIVIQDALGVNSHFRELCQRWAGEGYVAIAPEMFHRAQPGFQVDQLIREQIMPMIQTLTTDGIIADCRAAFDWLAARSDVRRNAICAVGFCMGGRAVFLANSELPLGAAISYYGGSIAPALLDRAAKLHAPHLFIWGDVDTSIPAEQRRAVADAVRDAGKKYVDVVFSGANHAFFNENLEDRYAPEAAKMSWTMSLSFLDEYLPE